MPVSRPAAAAHIRVELQNHLPAEPKGNPMSNEHLRVAHAAICIPMTWLAQGKFPPKAAVLTSFRNAVSFLSGIELYAVAEVRITLEDIISGTDPRGGTFAKQALAAAAKLHDLNARMAIATLDALDSKRQESL